MSDGWTFSVTPYFWAAGLSGETSSFWLPVVDIDADFSDVLDNLDFATMAIVDARYSRFSIFVISSIQAVDALTVRASLGAIDIQDSLRRGSVIHR